MKDAYAVLRQKELERGRLANEVEALRIAAPLLTEDESGGNQALRPGVNIAKPGRQ